MRTTRAVRRVTLGHAGPGYGKDIRPADRPVRLAKPWETREGHKWPILVKPDTRYQAVRNADRPSGGRGG